MTLRSICRSKIHRATVTGAAARRVEPGHRLFIVSFVLTDQPVDPLMIVVDDANRFKSALADSEPVLALR